MQENSYIQVLIQSLHQKVEALDSIIEKNQEQCTHRQLTIEWI